MNKYRIERGVLVDRELIEANPWNPNRTSDRQKQAIAESLDLYGQLVEILVRPHPEDNKRYQVIDGEHRLDILQEKIYVNIIYDLPEAHAKKLTIILNETRGEADKVELSKLLLEISEDLPEELLLGLPYLDKELEELLEIGSLDWDGLRAFDDNNTQETDSLVQDDNELTTLYLKINSEVMEKLQACRDLVEQERDLSTDAAVAWGEVIESILNDYLGGI